MIPPHRQLEGKDAMAYVGHAPSDRESFTLALDIARWRYLDVKLTNLVSQRLGLEMRGEAFSHVTDGLLPHERELPTEG